MRVHVAFTPADYVNARGETLILSTTNGTSAILEAARRCDEVWRA